MQLLCIQVFGLSLRDLRCPLTLNNYRIKNVLKKQQAYVIFYLIVLEMDLLRLLPPKIIMLRILLCT